MKQEVDYFEKFKGNVILNVPTALFKDNQYTGNDILVYALISALGYKSGYCYASNNTLANMCHKCSTKTIQRSINKLHSNGLLFKTYKVYAGRKYRILYTSDIAINENKDIVLKNLRTELEHNTVELFDYNWLEEDEENIPY